MSQLKTFRLYGPGNIPADYSAPVILEFRDKAGAVRSPPASVLNLGDGFFGVTASAEDIEAGSVALLAPDLPDVFPMHVTLTWGIASTPFDAMHFEASDGTLWTLDPPTITARNPLGASVAPPSLVALVAPYLYAVVPSLAQVTAGIAYVVTGAPGCLNTYDGWFSAPSTLGATDDVMAAVYAAVVGDPSVSALIGSRMFPNVLPQGTALPAIVYQVIDDIPQNVIEGVAADRMRNVRMQIDCYARPGPQGSPGAYAQAHAVADAVDAVVANFVSPQLSAWRDSNRDLFDDVTQYHRVSMDFSLWR